MPTRTFGSWNAGRLRNTSARVSGPILAAHPALSVICVNRTPSVMKLTPSTEQFTTASAFGLEANLTFDLIELFRADP